MEVSAPEKEKMDRGLEALTTHFSACSKMDIRQTRRGWLLECFCPCNAKNEFRYFIEENQIAYSLEESNWIMRWCFQPCYPYKMKVEELQTNAELLTVERPCILCSASNCKCCFYQHATFSAGDKKIGEIKEQCYFCVATYKMYDEKGEELYKLHPPTCLGGLCFNCFTEGNPCGRKGCCKVPFWIFPPGQVDTNGGDASHIGKILKKPKSAIVEIVTNANAFDVVFPADATPTQKASLAGAALFLNNIHFERGGDGN
jgi:hypothetical protein